MARENGTLPRLERATTVRCCSGNRTSRVRDAGEPNVSPCRRLDREVQLLQLLAYAFFGGALLGVPGRILYRRRGPAVLHLAAVLVGVVVWMMLDRTYAPSPDYSPAMHAVCGLIPAFSGGVAVHLSARRVEHRSIETIVWAGLASALGFAFAILVSIATGMVHF